jgi:hypothetical protein
MTGSAISTTGRRSIHPAVQFISLEAQPAALSRALPIPRLLGILSTPVSTPVIAFACKSGLRYLALHGIASLGTTVTTPTRSAARGLGHGAR